VKKENIEINPDGILKSRQELDEVWRIFNKRRWTNYWISIVFIILMGIAEAVSVFCFKFELTDWLLKFFKDYWVYLLAVAFVLLTIFEKSKLNKGTLERLWVPLNKVAIPYKKAEEDIIYGIQRERVRWVKRGVERLEGLNEYFSEMPEYNELLEKGKSWLKENEGK